MRHAAHPVLPGPPGPIAPDGRGPRLPPRPAPTTRRRGWSTIEIAIGLALVAVAATGFIDFAARELEDRAVQTAALEIKEVLDAAREHARARYATLEQQASPQALSLDALIAAGHLKWAAARLNPARHAYGVVVRSNPTADTDGDAQLCGPDPDETCPVEVLVVTQPATGSTPYTARQTARVAEIGGSNVGHIVDVSGVKRTRVANFNDVDLTTNFTATGGPTFAGGTTATGYYLAAARIVTSAATASPALARLPSADPNAATLHQSLDLNNNSITNVGQLTLGAQTLTEAAVSTLASLRANQTLGTACGPADRVGLTATSGLLVCVNGRWESPSSSSMTSVPRCNGDSIALNSTRTDYAPCRAGTTSAVRCGSTAYNPGFVVCFDSSVSGDRGFYRPLDGNEFCVDLVGGGSIYSNGYTVREWTYNAFSAGVQRWLFVNDTGGGAPVFTAIVCSIP